MELKTCNTCNADKPIDQFYKIKGKYLFPYCKECAGKKTQAWKSNNRQRTQAYRLFDKYGISVAEYEAMYAAVDGKCQICHKPRPVLSVDHDHATGKIRGLLCNNCNHALGKFFDDPEIITAALEYLLGRGFQFDIPVDDLLGRLVADGELGIVAGRA